MDLIARNPYRVLGVFADDTNKVRTANTGKIRAFLKVGKEVHFDIDVPNLLGSLNRTQEMLDNAISLLSDETEAALQALFWFHSGNENTASLIEVLSKTESPAGNDILGRKTVEMILNGKRKEKTKAERTLEEAQVTLELKQAKKVKPSANVWENITNLKAQKEAVRVAEKAVAEAHQLLSDATKSIAYWEKILRKVIEIKETNH